MARGVYNIVQKSLHVCKGRDTIIAKPTGKNIKEMQLGSIDNLVATNEGRKIEFGATREKYDLLHKKLQDDRRGQDLMDGDEDVKNYMLSLSW